MMGAPRGNKNASGPHKGYQRAKQAVKKAARRTSRVVGKAVKAVVRHRAAAIKQRAAAAKRAAAVKSKVAKSTAGIKADGHGGDPKPRSVGTAILVGGAGLALRILVPGVARHIKRRL